MSWILGIDTSSIALSIGLQFNSTPVASFTRYLGNSHAEHITQAIDSIVRINKITPHDIGHCTIAVGPGSFTGLRIGIAFAKGFCMGSPTKIAPLSSLHILAQCYLASQGRIVAAIDARQDLVYWAAFSNENGSITRIIEDSVTSLDEFKAYIRPEDHIVTDTMGYSKSTVFSFLRNRPCVYPVEQYTLQRGLAGAALGSRLIHDPQAWQSPFDIHPNYIRQSAAQSIRK